MASTITTACGIRASGRIIAKGGMGAVYQGFLNDEKVAIKVPLRELRNDESVAEQIRQEARILARLKHPNVVRFVSAGMSPAGPYVATEWLEGASLFDIVRHEAPLSFARLSNLFLQILDAVIACHAAGVIHADLKPENVMVVRRPVRREQAVLIDFGVACVEQQRSGSRDHVYGTPGFLAPELLSGQTPNAQSDIFALGTLLNELIVGRRFAVGSSLDSLATRPMRQTTVTTPSVQNTDDAQAVIARARRVEPGHRFASVMDMREAFVAAIPQRKPNTLHNWRRLLIANRTRTTLAA